MSTTTGRTAGRSHPTDHVDQPLSANRRRVFQAALVCVGILSPAIAPLAQVDRGGRKVSGTVVSAAAQRPVPAAGVRYEESDQPPQTTVTDAKGYFEFPTPGRLGVVTVTAPDYGTARRRWPPATGSALRVELMPPAIVRGTVSDLVTGRLVAAMVNVLVQHPGNFVSRSATAEGGTFQIEDLPPGPALMTARSEGFAPFVGSTTVDAGRVREVRIGLVLEAHAAGHVRDADGEPVSGAFVSTWYPDLPGAGLLEGFVGGRPLTGPDGAFALRGLVPDTPVALQAELDGRRSAVETVTVDPGMGRLDIVLTLP